MTPNKKLQAQLDDLISEHDLRKLLNYSPRSIKRLIDKGELTVRTQLSKERKFFSKTQVAKLLNLDI